ncbi:hypothetical protein ABKN59_009869 [Abortiporus biennis]
MASETKSFTIYTSTADPSNQLKHNAQIVLTVTPKNQRHDDLFISQTPLAWKVFDFASFSDILYEVNWSDGIGFSVASRAGGYIPVQLGQSGVLQAQAGNPYWEVSPIGTRGKVVARNETRTPQTFVLGSIDNDELFEPMVKFPSTAASQTSPPVDPPVMLQAWAASNVKVGQPLSQSLSTAYLLKRWDNTPQPINLAQLADGASIQLSTGRNGLSALSLVSTA